MLRPANRGPRALQTTSAPPLGKNRGPRAPRTTSAPPLGKTQCPPSVHRLTRGEAKLVREKQSASAPILGLCLAMPKAFWDEDLSAHSPGHNVAKSLRVRQLVARVHARCVRASTEEAAEKEGAAARTQRRWKRRPTATRRDGWLSE